MLKLHTPNHASTFFVDPRQICFAGRVNNLDTARTYRLIVHLWTGYEDIDPSVWADVENALAYYIPLTGNFHSDRSLPDDGFVRVNPACTGFIPFTAIHNLYPWRLSIPAPIFWLDANQVTKLHQKLNLST